MKIDSNNDWEISFILTLAIIVLFVTKEVSLDCIFPAIPTFGSIFYFVLMRDCQRKLISDIEHYGILKRTDIVDIYRFVTRIDKAYTFIFRTSVFDVFAVTGENLESVVWIINLDVIYITVLNDDTIDNLIKATILAKIDVVRGINI